VLKLFNTLKRTRETFEPLVPGRVTMYVCGMTVYSHAHIGNGRPYVVFDLLARLLRRRFELTYVRNITDVDDKINAAAKTEGVSIGTLTRRYTDILREDMERLGVLPPDIEPLARTAGPTGSARRARSSSSRASSRSTRKAATTVPRTARPTQRRTTMTAVACHRLRKATR
jgi:hypothetical protein